MTAERLARLPNPTNMQARNVLQKLLNRLRLAKIRTCRSLHSCVLCETDITYGETYRDKGYAARAHDDCFNAVNNAAVVEVPR